MERITKERACTILCWQSIIERFSPIDRKTSRKKVLFYVMSYLALEVRFLFHL